MSTTQPKRKVKFANDTKTFDGSCQKNLIYAKVCSLFFIKRIKRVKDILIFTKDIDMIDFFISEANISKHKLENLKKEMALDSKKNILLKCKRFSNAKENDLDWDNQYYENISKQNITKGVSLLRNGSSDKKALVKLTPNELPMINQMILLFEMTKKYLVLKSLKEQQNIIM